MKKLFAKIPKEKLKKYLKILIVLLIVAGISVGLYFLLKHLGYTDVDKLKGFLQKTGPWAIIVYIALRVVATIFLSFMPACSMMFDLLSLATFSYLPPVENDPPFPENGSTLRIKNVNKRSNQNNRNNRFKTL